MPMLTPSTVRAYLRGAGPVSLSDIALHFDSTPDAVRPVLALWQGKGRVRPLLGPGSAGACGRPSGACTCCHQPLEVYEWCAEPP